MNVFTEIHKDFYTIIDSSIHKNIINILQEPLTNNILLYGAKGLPHNILIDNAMFLKYGSFKKSEYVWEKELIYNETPYYIEIDIAHVCQPKNIDIIINFLKNIITHKSLQSDKKIIILYNIDKVCIKNKSYSFRVILERFSIYNIFICSTYSLSNIENPIKSRFTSYRIPLLSSQNINKILSFYNIHNDIALPFINNNNLQLSIIYSQLPLVNLTEYSEELSYNYPPLIEIFKSPTCEKIRNISHKISIHDIPIIDIVHDCIKFNPNNIHSIIAEATYIDHLYSISNSYLKPIYIEYLLHTLINKINI